jgi:hypothetical protein
MPTKFSKFPGNFPHNWAKYFHAGTEWLQTFQLLEDERKKDTGIFLFNVYPHVLYFSLELLVKSLASHEDPSFDAKKHGYGHSASKIIKHYGTTIPIFNTIGNDQPLMDLIKEFEKTLDTRFGETTVQLEGADTKLMTDTVYAIRAEMCKRTGLR